MDGGATIARLEAINQTLRKGVERLRMASGQQLRQWGWKVGRFLGTLLLGSTVSWGTITVWTQLQAQRLSREMYRQTQALFKEVQRQAQLQSRVQFPTSSPVFRNSVGMAFVLIPAGTFLMGGDLFRNEQPVHPVHLTRLFLLGQHEVTQGQWVAVLGANPSRFTGDSQRPVENVSWEEVQGFIRQLMAQEGHHYRLPTEAEWEYAARADTTTDYSFGNEVSQLGAYAWYGDNAEGTTHPVGHKQPNAWGLFDVYGNVWEWVQDWYGAYAADAVPDPQGPSSGLGRVFRGGSWNDDARLCRSAFRSDVPPSDRFDLIGFRLLREP
jgi:formylglycine-generating enzyme required for sulfatase activity